MKPIVEGKKGSWTVGGPQSKQPEYFPLEVRRCKEKSLWSAWRPSWKDIWRMVKGQPIRVGLLSNQQIPIRVVVDESEISF